MTTSITIFVRQQDVFVLFVSSCCDKSGISCYHFVTRLMTRTDSQQVVPTSPADIVCT